VDPTANELYGLSTRFKGCLKTRNEMVMMLDDDMLPPEVTVNNLLRGKLAVRSGDGVPGLDGLVVPEVDHSNELALHAGGSASANSSPRLTCTLVRC
jgi:hypothetical protein